MHFTLNDIFENFDRATYARGVDYAERGKVRSLAARDGRIDSEVTGTAGARYQQSIVVEPRKKGVSRGIL